MVISFLQLRKCKLSVVIKLILLKLINRFTDNKSVFTIPFIVKHMYVCIN